MDQRLVRWGRAVKARHRADVPPLWLFSDAARVPDLVTALLALPPGLCGCVLRHDQAAQVRRVAQMCRARRITLSVAGRGPVPAGGFRHLRNGSGRQGRRMTSSAHGAADIVRARRAGARVIFLSPAFATLSHPGAAAWGPLRWARQAGRWRGAVFALGGIDSATVRRLPRWARGVGAIGALLP